MNPKKAQTPVAFWVVNRNTDFSGGDYVDWHEVETVSVPKMLQECHKNPAAKLGDLSAVIKNNPGIRRGNPCRAAGGSRFTHRYRIRTADGGR